MPVMHGADNRADSLPALRICLVVDSLDVGGAERHVVDLARRLDGEGHAVTVACSVGGPLSLHLKGTGVRVHALLPQGVKRTVNAEYARRLEALIRREQFDLVHAHIYASEAATALAATRAGVPLVLTEHSEGRWQGKMERTVSRWFLSRAHQTIAVSGGIARRLILHLGVPANRVSLIPNAAAPLTDLDRSPLPALPGAGDGCLLVGVVARLSPEKGHDIFLEAAAQVAPLIPEASFLVVGDGVLRGAFERRARELGGRVCFLGTRPDARAIMARLDILAVPSRSEGSPLVVLEGLACGVPIVAAAVGGIPRQIRHDREGLLVPPGDPVALARALRCLLCDHDRRARLARGAAARHDGRAYDAAIGHTLEVYRQACGTAPRRPVSAPSPRPQPPDCEARRCPRPPSP